MHNQNYIEEVLDAVVKDRLPEAQAVFILREQQVTDAQSEIALHRAAAAVVRQYAIQAQIRSVHEEYVLQLGREAQPAKATAIIRTFPWKTFLRVAAILVLVLSGWFTLQLAYTNGERLYAELYQPFTIDTERGQAENAQPDMLERFKAGDYAGVIRLYGQYKEPDNRARFLAAYAFQSTGDFQASIKPLRTIISQNQQSGSMLYQDEAEYYLGLALLRVQAYDEAEQVFTKIVQEPDHTYHGRLSTWKLRRLRWLK